MKVLFALFAEIGHVNPFIGVMRRLVDGGHDVAVFCARNYGPQLERAGIAVRWFHEPQEPLATRPQQLAARMRNPRWLERWYELAMSTIPASVDSIARAVAEVRPDVMCVDPLMVSAAIVATRERIPWIAVATNFTCLRPTGWSCPFFDAADKIATRLRAQLDAHGAASVELNGTEVVSPRFNSVFTTEALVAGVDRANRYATFVGPARPEGPRGDDPEFPWERLDDRPLVYVSSGGGQSVAFEPACVLEIARVLAPDEANVVLAVQDLVDDAAFMAAVPRHTIVTRYAPQLALLDRAAVAVTHGGVNTFNESIDRGCPMLVLPIAKDQPLQAELARRAGVGMVLDPTTLSAAACGEALRTLIGDPGVRDRTRALQASYRPTASAASIVDAIVAS